MEGAMARYCPQCGQAIVISSVGSLMSFVCFFRGFSGLGEARAGSRANSYLAYTFRGGQSDNKKSGLFSMSSTEALRSP